MRKMKFILNSGVLDKILSILFASFFLNQNRYDRGLRKLVINLRNNHWKGGPQLEELT